jgi:anti-sigma factor RsiW
LEAEIKALEAKLMRSFLHGSYEVSTRLAAARRELEAARAEMQSPSMVRAEKERGQKQRQLKLHWSWLLALAVLLAGSGVMALDWFADAHNQVTVSYSGK